MLGLSDVTFLETLYMLCTCLGGMIKGPLKRYSVGTGDESGGL